MAGRIRFALAALAAIAAPLAAATPAPADYDVRVVMREGDRAPMTPRLIVRAGEPATFMVGNERYSLRLIATPGPGNRVSLASQVSTWTPEGLRNDGRELDILANGETGTMSFTSTDPKTGLSSEIRIEVSVRPAAD